VKVKLDENLPASAAAILQAVGHDVDTVFSEGLTGATDPDVLAAATAAGRILISLDRGLGDIRTYPPGSHAGIVVLRLTDQSPATVSKAIADLASLTDPATSPEPSQSCNEGYFASAIPDCVRDAGYNEKF
jgi:predicted nuclease of predicted toxin-antitoxin system